MNPVIWSIIQQIGKQIVNFAVFAILALLLEPKDFGILGMAFSWIAFITVFSELGFSAAIIQRQQIESKHLNTTFLINIGTGILLTLIGICLSWPSAAFYRTPEVRPVFVFLSFGFIIAPFSLTQIAIAQREFKFRELAIRDLIASAVGGIVGIALALFRYGVWSLVWQSLITNFVGTILIWKLAKWRPSFFDVSLSCIRELWNYSSKIFSFNLFKYFTQNIDKLLIGYLLGPTALGLYTFAYKLVILPINQFVGAIGIYLFPKFSRLQEDLKVVTSSYLQVIKVINSFVMPAMVIDGMLSPILIPIIFGPKWVEAIRLIQIFTLVALLQSFISPVGQLMKALNRPGWLFKWSIWFTFIVGLFLWWGSFWGIIGVAIGLTLSHIFGLPVIYYITSKLLIFKSKDVFNSLFPTFISSLVLGFLVWIALFFKILSDIAIISIGLPLCGAIYVLTLTLIDRRFISMIFQRIVKV